jgi:hypothetical protein
VGSEPLNTSLIMGFATEKIPIPPIASEVNVMPSRWNWGDLGHDERRKTIHNTSAKS